MRSTHCTAAAHGLAIRAALAGSLAIAGPLLVAGPLAAQSLRTGGAPPALPLIGFGTSTAMTGDEIFIGRPEQV
ncbi:MAG: hypothetical protein ACRELC_13455, partial [Gemmatimonadota bacterium]